MLIMFLEKQSLSLLLSNKSRLGNKTRRYRLSQLVSTASLLFAHVINLSID